MAGPPQAGRPFSFWPVRRKRAGPFPFRESLCPTPFGRLPGPHVGLLSGEHHVAAGSTV